MWSSIGTVIVLEGLTFEDDDKLTLDDGLSFYEKVCFYSGVKTFWVIQNIELVISSIKKLNKRGKAKSISTFDFSKFHIIS